MSSELDQLIQVGYDLTLFKYYSLATCTILFYDHLLTLADEIKYVWSGKKRWTFWLFLVNRYFPMTYQFWQLAVSYGPQLRTNVCNKTAWYTIFMFVICTFLAQVVLTLRIYAVTLKSIPIAAGFAVITSSQFVLGIYMITIAAREGAQTPPPIPIDAFRLCLFSRHRSLEIATISISLLYDFLAFSVIVFLAVKAEGQGTKIPTILRSMAEDATRYFLVIFTSHFILEMTLNLGRESIQLIPGVGVVVYLPVMISRIMISLRKAADVQQRVWLPGETDVQNVMAFRPRGALYMRQDDIPLDTYPGAPVAV